MTSEKLPETGPSNPPTSTSTSATQAQQGSKKGGKTKKPDKTEEKVPMTFSVSVGFSKKLRMLSGSLDESTSDYVEAKLSPIVSRDLKKVMEEMG